MEPTFPQKKKEVRKMEPMTIVPDKLRPGDCVLDRQRSNGNDIRPRDVLYVVESVSHYRSYAAGDDTEVEHYITAPDKIVAYVRYRDFSDGRREWNGSNVTSTWEFDILRPKTVEV